MSVLWVLVGFSVLVAGGFLIAYIWAVRSGQYDDPLTPSIRMLFEDEKKSSTLDAPSTTNAEGSADNGDAEDQL